MSRIVNEAKVKNPLIVGIREQLEHRALWMYLLCDEAEKHGLKAEEFAPDAIKRCGLYQGANLVKRNVAEGPQKGALRMVCTAGVRDGHTALRR